jgi:hypothetical protein
MASGSSIVIPGAVAATTITDLPCVAHVPNRQRLYASDNGSLGNALAGSVGSRVRALHATAAPDHPAGFALLSPFFRQVHSIFLLKLPILPVNCT